MDKTIINAVAGSGKTTLIIKKIDPSKKILILTYTLANQENIKTSVIKKFGCLPDNIMVLGWFSFLLNYCIKPYYPDLNITSMIQRNTTPRYEKKSLLGNLQSNGKNFDVFQNKISIHLINTEEHLNVLNKFFDEVYVDEVQDLYGYDLDLLHTFAKTTCTVFLVGDFYQHTYKSSQFKGYGKIPFKTYFGYLDSFEKAGFDVDTTTLKTSYRCSHEICKFIEDNLKIKIVSSQKNKEVLRFVKEENEIIELINDINTVKLFYNNWEKYNMNCQNWGNSKGLTYNSVLVILNKDISEMIEKSELHKLSNLAFSTKSKLYVALTRSSGSTFIVTQTDFLKVLSNQESIYNNVESK